MVSVHSTPRANAGMPRRAWLQSAGVSLTTAIGVTALQACGGASAEESNMCVRQDEFPDFFDQAPQLRVRDPLAKVLGSARDGVLEFRYEDAVRLTGHACPVTAGAYLMALNGLERLYGGELPERGRIEVMMKGGRSEGVVGVYASVIQLLTGAAVETGFPGLGANGSYFSRRNLMSYNHPELAGLFVMRRPDNGRAVQLRIDTSKVNPPNAELTSLVPLVAGGTATETQQKRLIELWLANVRRMLIDHPRDPEMIIVSDWKA